MCQSPEELFPHSFTYENMENKGKNANSIAKFHLISINPCLKRLLIGQCPSYLNLNLDSHVAKAALTPLPSMARFAPAPV